MKMFPMLRAGLRRASLILGFLPAGFALLQAAEKPINNATFDDLAPSPAWYWENWSRAGSTVTYDATLDAGGGTVASGSLRLSGPFDPANSGWQEAVFTLDIDDFDASKYQSISFDVLVDPSSTPRAAGDYGNVQVILRNGGNWVWKQLDMIPLTGTSWRRVTAVIAHPAVPDDNDIRAITIRIAANEMAGTVVANIDNIVFNDEVVIDNFDDGNIDGWTATWGSTPDLKFDNVLDRAGRHTSGSLRVAANYFTPQTSWQQSVVTVPFNSVNAPDLYTSVNVDVKIDPASTLSSGGNYGYFEIKLPNGTALAGFTLTTTEWTRLSFPITPAVGNISSFLFQLGGGDFLGPITYNLDNLSWTRRTGPPPPPTLSLEKGVGGLNLVHTSSDQYGRHNIYTADSSALGFRDEPAPVTYSIKLLSFPDAATAPGFQTHLFLVPGGGGSETSPDWYQPNLIFLDIRAGAGGSGSCTFRFKINQPNGNSQLYAGGLPVVNSVSVRGTWALTVSGNTHFVVTSPDGSTVAYDMAADAAGVFTGPLRLYVGVQGNNPNNIGQRARLGGVTVTKGATVVLEDHFSGDALDTSKWVVNSTPGGVQFLPASEAGYLVTWTLPDDGFGLEWTEAMEETPFWVPLPPTAVPYAIGPGRRQVNIPTSQLPTSDQVFFRMAK